MLVQSFILRFSSKIIIRLDDLHMYFWSISYLEPFCLRNLIFKKIRNFRPVFNRFLPEFHRLDMGFQPAAYQPDRTGKIFQPAGPDRFSIFQPVPALVWKDVLKC
jgi:hypothetical protein